MLSLIRVKNYAVIDEVELELDPGFSVVTGETGAGKSILVDALALALGDRADASAVRQGADRAEISVSFDCARDHAAVPWLRERGLDDGDSCTLRRVIGAEGRSRAFINGQPATLQDLKILGGLLIDIHGQHAHQSLLDAGSHRELLDAPGGLGALAERVASAYRAWQDLAAALAERHGANADRAAQIELTRFQVGELEALALGPDEPGELRAERDRLANTDKLLSGVSGALERLFDSDVAAYSAVVRAGEELEHIVEHDAELRAAHDRLAAVEIELRDLESTLNRYRDGVEANPVRLEWLEARLGKIRTLARRHGVEETDLPSQLAALQARLAQLEGGEDSVETLAAKVEAARSAYFEVARKLSSGRAKHARAFAKEVSAQLPELGMPHGELRVELEAKPEERADGTGLERVELQVRLNPGQPFGPLSRMASGGELSRLSLAIEVARSGASPKSSFVFDEVDAGIGGRVAEIVGRKLAALAGTRQVLCVTHLPQVASQGQRHYRVVKLTDGKTSRTNVRRLTSEERVEELSRMLGGVEITERTRAHAAEMIDRAAK
jgi:DNA repair protein RecN (Recombination protein N)